MSKIWGCTINDPIFDDITLPQWYFYAEMIYQDRKIEWENQTAITEYLASFWNPKAVEKAQEIRNSKKQHKFKDDMEFEDHVVSGKYKESTLLDAVRKIRNLDKETNQRIRTIKKKEKRKTKLPTDLSSIHSTLGKFK